MCVFVFADVLRQYPRGRWGLLSFYVNKKNLNYAIEMSVTTKSTGCLTWQRTIFIELFWQIATTRAGANCSLKCARPLATHYLIALALRLCAWVCATFGLNDDHHDHDDDDDRMMTLHRLTVWLMKPAKCLLHGLGLGLLSIYYINIYMI